MNNKKQILVILASVIVAVFSVAIITQAVTTVGNDVSVGGALTVTGTSTVSQLRLISSSDSIYVSQVATSTGDWIVSSNLGQLLKTDSVNFNVLLGQQAANNWDGLNNVFMGYQTGYYNTSSQPVNLYGKYNTYIGYRSGYGSATVPGDLSGFYNVAVGSNALLANSVGHRNTAIGNGVMMSNTSGVRNIAMGSGALYANTTGSYNVSLGISTLSSARQTGYNTAVGSQAGFYASSSNNTFIGYNAGYGTSAYLGANNIFVGYQAGDNITTGSNNIVLGYDINVVDPTGSNQLNIGNTIYGNLSTGLVGIGTTTPAYNLEVSSSASTTIMIGSGALTGCLGIGDTDKAGITWCTALDGTLTCTSTKPQQCK